MKALQINYDGDSDQISTLKEQSDEDWIEVCDRYDDDVHRIRDVEDQQSYTGLYECFDEDNRPVYYLVEEDHKLKKIRQKVFLSKLGR